MTAFEALDVPRSARLTSEDFLVLARSGAFLDYAKAELIKGEVVVVNAQFRRHAAIRRQLMRRLEDALASLAEGLGAVDECNVALGDANMPQPDITITAEPDGDGPIPLASVKLVVEIADTTLDHDLGRKRDLYAGFGVPEYWVVDAKGSLIVQMWAPGPDGYTDQREIALGERIDAVTITGLAVETQGI